MSGVQMLRLGTQTALGTQGCSPAAGCSALGITLTWQRELGTSFGGGTCLFRDNRAGTALVEGCPGTGAAAPLLQDRAVNSPRDPDPSWPYCCPHRAGDGGTGTVYGAGNALSTLFLGRVKFIQEI